MKLKFIHLFLVLFFFMSCKSHKKINRLASNLNCDQAIDFVFDERSNNVVIEKDGFALGESESPDYEQTFIQAVEELKNNLESKIRIVENHQVTTDSSLKVEVKIDKIIWIIRSADFTMKTDLIFQFEEKEISTTGSHTVYLMGTKKGNLRKSIKDGIYRFLKTRCSQK